VAKKSGRKTEREAKSVKYEEVSKYSDRKFKRVVGVNRMTFQLMSEIVGREYKEKHQRGRSTKLSVEDMLLVAMEYWYEKRTYEQIAASYGLDSSNVCRSIKWVEGVLVQDGTFRLLSSLIEPQHTEPVVRKAPEISKKESSETMVMGH